jgi:hypothetical protein
MGKLNAIFVVIDTTDFDLAASLARCARRASATRRDDLQHATNAAYAHGCVCSDFGQSWSLRRRGVSDGHWML